MLGASANSCTHIVKLPRHFLSGWQLEGHDYNAIMQHDSKMLTFCGPSVQGNGRGLDLVSSIFDKVHEIFGFPASDDFVC